MGDYNPYAGASPASAPNDWRSFGTWLDILLDKSNDIPSVEDYSAVGGGVVDDGPAIKRAIDAVGLTGGGILRLNNTIYGVATDIIENSNNVLLLGKGASWASNKGASSPTHWTQFGGTVLKALAGCTNVLTFRPVYDNVTGTRLVGSGMDGIVVDCAGVAASGVIIESLAGGYFPHLSVSDPVTAGIVIGVTGENNLPDVNRVGGIGPTGAYEEPRDTQHCMFGKVFVRIWNTAALGAKGIVLNGDDEADVSYCNFQHISYWHKNGTGLELNSSDGCTFGRLDGFRIAGGVGKGVQIRGGASVTDFPRHHYFGFVQAGAGGFDVVANAVKPADITIATYSRGNASPAMTFEDGCAPYIIHETSGFERKIINDADGRTLTTNESGSLITNSGATARADFTLPTAAAGYRFGFTCSDTDGIRVIASAGDTIRVGVDLSAVAGRIDSTTIGSVVWLVSLDATEWRAEQFTGVWTVT